MNNFDYLESFFTKKEIALLLREIEQYKKTAYYPQDSLLADVTDYYRENHNVCFSDVIETINNFALKVFMIEFINN